MGVTGTRDGTSCVTGRFYLQVTSPGFISTEELKCLFIHSCFATRGSRTNWKQGGLQVFCRIWSQMSRNQRETQIKPPTISDNCWTQSSDSRGDLGLEAWLMGGELVAVGLNIGDPARGRWNSLDLGRLRKRPENKLELDWERKQPWLFPDHWHCVKHQVDLNMTEPENQLKCWSRPDSSGTHPEVETTRWGSTEQLRFCGEASGINVLKTNYCSPHQGASFPLSINTHEGKGQIPASGQNSRILGYWVRKQKQRDPSKQNNGGGEMWLVSKLLFDCGEHVWMSFLSFF